MAAAVGYSELGRYSELNELEAYSSGGRSGWLEDAQEGKAIVSPRKLESWWIWRGMKAAVDVRRAQRCAKKKNSRPRG